MIPGGFLEQLPSLGVAGLLFVMWWLERLERSKTTVGAQDALKLSHQVAGFNEQLLGVVRANTEALTALREELRSHRLTETEWMGRLSRQLDGRGE